MRRFRHVIRLIDRCRRLMRRMIRLTLVRVLWKVMRSKRIALLFKVNCLVIIRLLVGSWSMLNTV